MIVLYGELMAYKILSVRGWSKRRIRTGLKKGMGLKAQPREKDRVANDRRLHSPSGEHQTSYSISCRCNEASDDDDSEREGQRGGRGKRKRATLIQRNFPGFITGLTANYARSRATLVKTNLPPRCRAEFADRPRVAR